MKSNSFSIDEVFKIVTLGKPSDKRNIRIELFSASPDELLFDHIQHVGPGDLVPGHGQVLHLVSQHLLLHHGEVLPYSFSSASE